MKCLTPVSIKNPKQARGYTDMYIHVPCGKCTICLKRRASGWAFRLKNEELHCETSAFVTYTYDDEHLPISPNGYATLDRSHHQKFMKRLRKVISQTDYEPKLKYYMVGEYGGQTHRPHYHAILFNLPEYYIVNPERLKEIWTHGNVQIDEVSNASIAYVCGYVQKQLFFSNFGENDDREKEYANMSKGLGIDFLTEARIKSMKQKLNPFLTIEDGMKITLPRYYRNKALSEDEILEMGIRSTEYILSQEDPFKNDERHKHEYIKHQSRMRKLNSIQKRNKL